MGQLAKVDVASVIEASLIVPTVVDVAELDRGEFDQGNESLIVLQRIEGVWELPEPTDPA